MSEIHYILGANAVILTVAAMLITISHTLFRWRRVDKSERYLTHLRESEDLIDNFALTGLGYIVIMVLFVLVFSISASVILFIKSVG